MDGSGSNGGVCLQLLTFVGAVGLVVRGFVVL